MNTLTTTLKNAAISSLIITAMQTGMTLPQAFDAVLGEGAYMKLAGEVYHSLRGE